MQVLKKRMNAGVEIAYWIKPGQPRAPGDRLTPAVEEMITIEAAEDFSRNGMAASTPRHTSPLPHRSYPRSSCSSDPNTGPPICSAAVKNIL